LVLGFCIYGTQFSLTELLKHAACKVEHCGIGCNVEHCTNP